MKNQNTMAPLQRGDKLYSCVFGTLVTVSYVSVGMIENGVDRTYIIRKADGEKSYCPTDMYYRTKREAYQRYLTEARKNLPDIKTHLEKIRDDVASLEANIVRIQGLMDAEPQ